MGKKKQARDTANKKPTEESQPEKPKSSKAKDEKGKRTYTIQKTDGAAAGSDGDTLPKISIGHNLERDLLSLIQSCNQERDMGKEVSNRLTNKKLTDMYNSLSGAGFAHKQIEQAMESTVLHGGDLIDALDWLCLNTPNEKLPANFSQALHKEEEKLRAMFDASHQVEPPVSQQGTSQTVLEQPTAEKNKSAQSADESQVSSQSSEKSQVSVQKDWILQYAEQESEDSEDSDSQGVKDPNERYLELTALLLDAKAEAMLVKKSGDKARQKEISKVIRQYVAEMKDLESLPDFNPAVKIKDDEEERVKASEEEMQKSCEAEAAKSENKTQESQVKDADEDMGFALFEEAAMAESKPKEKQAPPAKLDVRNFEYTRQQWTGKSPKQFLIDWCRKHLKNSPPPKFDKVNAPGHNFKCRAKIDRKKDGGLLEVCPDILCTTVKEAEHLAATLALYQLCRGQPVYQLLPPPYRDVWLEWLDAEKKAKQEEQAQENKQRDQFLAKLMSKIQVTDKSKGQSSKVTEDSGDTLESWEDMEFDDQESEDNSQPEQMEKSKIKERRKGPRKPVAMADVYRKNESSAQYQALLKSRQELPVYKQRELILESLAKHSVILVAGETGSGKSTQVPHFLLRSCLMGGMERCNIVCTEPRRISAISLAKRVSQEMGEQKLGAYDSLCGYQIRFESRCGPNTRLTYCTTGVLLRKLQSDPQLSEVTHIVVDEVHERSVQSDFLLVILRQLLRQRDDLKVVLMSATLDADKFCRYFSHCPVINIPGRTHPVQVLHVEDMVEQTGYVLDEDSPYALRQSELVKEETATVAVTEKGGNQSQVDLFWTKEDLSSLDRTCLSSDTYSLKTRNTVTRMNLRRINLDLIVEILLHLETGYAGIDGAVLVFLPGLADITELYEALQSDRRFLNKDKYLIIALHSVLSSADQTQAFTVPPPGVRKVVLATNIAETGITIPDVVFVIDSGKVKENRYIESSQMSSLEEVYISKASAKQRAGRAGRVRPGYCFRLLTKHMYDEMKPYTVPELLRVPLEELCLHIMKCEFGQPEDFLSQALDPPQSTVVSRAMSLLHSIGACVDGQQLSPLGHHLATLPVHVRIGKMLLYAVVFGCLEPVAVIASAMTNKSPFVAPIGKQDLANAAKQALAVAASDHLTIYKAYLGWQEAKSNGRQAELTYCQKNFLKRNTLLEMENVKTDLMKLVYSIGFRDSQAASILPSSEIEKDGVLQISKHQTKSKLDQKTISKVKAVLTAGLYPNVAKVTYEAPVDAAANPEQKVCVGETPQGPASVHPSSVNRHLQASGWLVFHEKVKSSRIYLRDCSLISAFPLLLFGGQIDVQHVDQIVSIDDRIKYKAYAKTGVIFKELRKLLDDLLAQKLEDPKLDISGNPLVSLIEELLVSEKPPR